LINGLLGIAYAYWDPSHPQASTIKCVPFGKKQFVPSHVGYGGNGEVLWGDAASGSAVPGYTWTKVLLNDDGPQEHSFGSGLLSRLVRNGFFYMSKDKPDTVVVDFLKQVRKHVAAHLELDYMEEVPPTEFWFTIPATWTEKARDRFLRAINLAGFGTRPQDHVLFLLEAEAAALAVPDQLPPLQVALPSLLCGIAFCDPLGIANSVDCVPDGEKQGYRGLRLWRSDIRECQPELLAQLSPPSSRTCGIVALLMHH
jgi:hypothetical protein